MPLTPNMIRDATSDASENRGERLRMARVLVIDDDEIVKRMTVQLLLENGLEADGAHDGNCGLNLLASKPFDLVVTDLFMPEKEGIETIISIRNKNKSLPIIAISEGGRMDSELYLRIARYLGADYAFKKPLDRHQFLTAIEECLSRRARVRVIR
jgi:two-component system, chemotaxis family, chemotaxis protein CheY